MMGYGLGVGWWDVDVGFGRLRASFGFAIFPFDGGTPVGWERLRGGSEGTVSVQRGTCA